MWALPRKSTPFRFPKLHNPEPNGLARDPTVKPKNRLSLEDDDDDDLAEKTVSQKLVAALRANRARVLDLFRQMDENGDGEISRDEFMTAFQEEDRIMDGLDVPTSACGALFDEWDADGSGSISFGELRKILRKPRKPAATQQLRPRRGRAGGRRARSQPPPESPVEALTT